MNIKVFLHLTDIGTYRSVLDDQVNIIENSGLINNADFYFHCNYNIENFKWIQQRLANRKNCHFINSQSDPKDLEFPTLIDLKTFCNYIDTDTAILYCHLKGVTHAGSPIETNITDWRNLLQYFNIVQWNKCVNLLDQGYDTVGVNFLQKPYPHYSGNFWWAKSGYIRSLPKLVLPSTIDFKKQLFESVEEYRHEAEMWIGYNNPKYATLHQSNAHHYRDAYPTYLYK